MRLRLAGVAVHRPNTEAQEARAWLCPHRSSRSTHLSKQICSLPQVSQQYFGAHPHESFSALTLLVKFSQGRLSQFSELQVSSSPQPSARSNTTIGTYRIFTAAFFCTF